MTGAFSQNVGKLFSELKLVPDNLFIYAEANWEAHEWNVNNQFFVVDKPISNWVQYT